MRQEAVRTTKQDGQPREKTALEALQHALHTGAPLMRRTLLRSERVTTKVAYALWGRGLEEEIFVELSGS